MNLAEIKTVPIPRHKRVRVGRGAGSGKGCTSGKGNKGQKSRSGANKPGIFEGGTMPLYRRVPKRGFNNKQFAEIWVSCNVDALNAFKEGEIVTLKSVAEKGLLKYRKCDRNVRFKILGNGELKVKNLKIKAHKVSEKAQEQIEKMNGNLEIIRINKFKRPRRRANS
ncbi:MAG TPA: 50S ribosomal protein L15 [Planctomycetota bacterium]|nr:50S ribosomal protein L15 [Planctomycetota bacterium]